MSYSSADIEVLEGLEPVRRRPGMYIAGTDTPAGLHQLVTEIVDNSVDEAMNGHADLITVILHKDGESVTVSDNGRGIPVEPHPIHKKPALELILTTLHAGGKFSDKNYKTAGGLHGVGSSVVNALSSQLIATIKRDNGEFQQEFRRGVPQGKIKKLRTGVKGSGTTIFFRPDIEIFKNVSFNNKTIRENLTTRAYLNPGLKINFNDEVSGTKEEFFFPEGISAYLAEILKNSNAQLVHDEPFLIVKNEEIEVTLAFAWTEFTEERFYSFANGIRTPDGGTHELGAKNGIIKAVRNYLSVHDIQTKGLKIVSEDIREGLVGVVSVKLPGGTYQAQFQGQTKDRLNNPEVLPLVENVAKGLEQILNEKPSVAQLIVSRIILSAKARAASRSAIQDVKRKLGVSHRLNLPGKLADCSSSKPEQCELFIVEGDSAGGSAKQGRNREFQAVLPLRGKVLNTINNDKKALENKELSNIVSALGAGAEAQFRADKLRYKKVIILTDADADGMHIATLLLAFFFQHMRGLVEAGSLYIGRPPLFGIFYGNAAKDEDKKDKKKGGKKQKALWAYSDSELNELLKTNNLKTPRIVRYKGLGEMNPDTLWDTTLDPDNRTLLRITIQDETAVSECLQNLMGSDSTTRYNLIRDNAEHLAVDI